MSMYFATSDGEPGVLVVLAAENGGFEAVWAAAEETKRLKRIAENNCRLADCAPPPATFEDIFMRQGKRTPGQSWRH